tara:strand:- start:436 stop:711 length:276 start_codon:yes stop_codon:yes gene_type:complete
MNKKTLMKFLRTTEALTEKDNIVYAEKAFVINQVMQHIAEKNLADNQLIKVLALVNKYINNEVTLFFRDDNIIVEFMDEEEITDDVLANSL